MLRYIKFSVFILVLFSAIGCSNKEEADADNQELADKLYFYNWGENVNPQILEDFEEEYGVEVVYDTYTSNQELLTKLNSGVAAYDIVIPTDYFAEKMYDEDLLHDLDMENIPNFENIEDEFKERSYDPDNTFSVPYLYGSIGIAYNKTKVDNPKNWDSLWDPQYEGRAIVQETPQEVVSMALQKINLGIENPPSEDMANAKTELEKLKPNILAYESTPAAKLINEEAWIAQSYSDQAGIAISENSDIDYFLPEEGGMLWMDNFVIPKSAPSKYTAEVFINYMLEAEVSKLLSDEIPSSNPNKAAKELMSEEEINNPASYPEIPDNSVYFDYTDPDVIGEMNSIIKDIKTN